MRNYRWLVLAIVFAGCSKDECADEEGCDSGGSEESYEPTGTVSVEVRWAESTNLQVTFEGVKRARFGIVEPGGWLGEDCPDGDYCHDLINPGDELAGSHNLVSIQTGTDADRYWDGTLGVKQTWMRREDMEGQVWALFSWGGQCLKVGGEDDTLYDHYVHYGCPR